ncbi:MAG TPA: MFS transporter [Desulfofustis sp.]|jgi:PAT family beta-lactamase induction signal transducer AmpG|nr:MFS transporter [Desulfofustis sp.]HBH32526.1 MFS transporter [Desulfofustis sp.]
MTDTASAPGNTTRSWRETFMSLRHPRVVTMLMFGFSAGLPLLLIFSSLSAWLTEAGVARAAVTFFSWAALGFSFKFVWAPLVDQVPLPWLTRRLGRRRGWLLVAQLLVVVAICWMALTDPTAHGGQLVMMACAAVMLGFSAATQDIVIDAYRIECAEKNMQALLAASYMTGYRIGMIFAGAGSLLLATYFGSTAEQYSYEAWRLTYLCMAGCMAVGIATTLSIDEPAINRAGVDKTYSTSEYSRIVLLFGISATVFISSFYFSGSIAVHAKQSLGGLLPTSGHVIGFFVEAARLLTAIICALIGALTLTAARLVKRSMLEDFYINPIRDFFSRYPVRLALLILLLIGTYRISDIVLGVIANVFYLELGFSKPTIGTTGQVFGMVITIAGTFVGGMLTTRYGVIRILFLGALLSAATNILFIILAQAGPNLLLLRGVIAADNLAGGIAAASFIAFLSSLTSISFTASQYAIFSSLMTLFPKLLGGYSGTISTAVGYPGFFLFTALLGVPVLVLIVLVRKVE